MRSRYVPAAVAAAFLISAAVAAQTPEKMSKPGPEQKRIGYFVGTWKSDTDVKPNPFTTGGRIAMTDNCEWFPGGFHVVCNSSGTGPQGPMKGIGIIGYNPEEKTYTYYGIDNRGMGSLSKGSIQGNTWDWHGEDKMGGKLIKSRYTIVENSPTAYTFKWETSEDGRSWTTAMEGKATKTGGSSK